MPNFSSGKWDFNTGKVGGSYSIWATRDGEDMPVKIASLMNNSSRLSKNEREANARLFAAAPDLYFTLCECASLLERLIEWDYEYITTEYDGVEDLLIKTIKVLDFVENTETETLRKEATNDE